MECRVQELINYQILFKLKMLSSLWHPLSQMLKNLGISSLVERIQVLESMTHNILRPLPARNFKEEQLITSFYLQERTIRTETSPSRFNPEYQILQKQVSSNFYDLSYFCIAPADVGPGSYISRSPNPRDILKQPSPDVNRKNL